VIAAFLSACGRIDFAELTDAAGASGDGAMLVANRAFVTSATFTGNLGGLSGADAKCMSAATTAGRSGTFVAFLSATTTDAIARVAGSRGWVRTDGVPVFDQITDAFPGGVMYAPIDHDEAGVRVSSLPEPRIFSGSDANGRLNSNPFVETCADWIDGTSAQNALYGSYTGTGPEELDIIGEGCQLSAHLICLEIGHAAPLAPPSAAVTGRHVFVSSLPTGTGLAALDAVCTSDATSAGLPGTYRAAVATSTTTIASRFTADARPVERIDGTVVAATTTSFLSAGVDLLANANQMANGTFTTTTIWTGAPDPVTVAGTGTTGACANWTDRSTSLFAVLGMVADASSPVFWGYATFGGTNGTACSLVQPVLCLEE
jgi:hypothetical protein